MSDLLMSFANKFAQEEIDAVSFSEAYICLWKIERDLGYSCSDERSTSEKLSTIFCLVDLLNIEPNRLAYELSSEQLLSKVREIIG
jgi:hypothetical protein